MDISRNKKINPHRSPDKKRRGQGTAKYAKEYKGTIKNQIVNTDVLQLES